MFLRGKDEIVVTDEWIHTQFFSRERDVDGRTPITMRHRVNRVIDDILDQRLTVPANVTVAT